MNVTNLYDLEWSISYMIGSLYTNDPFDPFNNTLQAQTFDITDYFNDDDIYDYSDDGTYVYTGGSDDNSTINSDNSTTDSSDGS